LTNARAAADPTVVSRRRVAPEIVTLPADGACRVRGFGILNSMHFAHQRFGSHGVERTLAHLGERDLVTVDTLRSLSWYPFALHCRVLRAVDRAHGDGDLALLFDLGKHSAARDWPRLFRPALKIGRPGWMLDVATSLWRVFHGEGRWTLERTKYEIVARHEEWREPDEAYCASFIGYMTAALELSGAVDVAATHVLCAARGAPHCVYTVRFGARASVR